MTGPRPAGGRAATLAAVFCGLLLCAAALPKLRAPGDFALAIYRYQVLPDPLVSAAAVYVPWCEAVAGLALALLPRYRRAGWWIGLLLSAAFTGVTASALARGLSIPCGCFSVGPGAEPLGWLEVVRAGLLTALCALALRVTRRPYRWNGSVTMGLPQ